MSSTTDTYEITALRYDADAGTVDVSVMEPEGFDLDVSETEWTDADVGAHLAATYGGTWARRGEWDGVHEHPARVESVSAWRRVG